jgi:hypothetical protein
MTDSQRKGCDMAEGHLGTMAEACSWGRSLSGFLLVTCREDEDLVVAGKPGKSGSEQVLVVLGQMKGRGLKEQAEERG